MIKNRKKSVSVTRISADTCALGLAMVSLTAFNLARAAAPADPQPQVLRGVTVTEEVEEESYKADTASSPKFTAPLLDTPQTITVIKKELLDDQGLGSLADALRNTPGITFTLGENGNSTAGDTITMRGFDTSGSIFLDGVRDLGAVARDTFNVEQIEVVKGPSGSDNGRGSPTGYINQSSKQPTLEDAISGALSAGTGSRIRFEGDLNESLDAISGAAVRLNLMYDKGDKPGRDVVDNERWGIAPSLALGLGGDTRAYFNFLFMKQNNTPDGGIPTTGLPGFATNNATPAIADAIRAAPPVDSSNYYGSLNDHEDVQAKMFTARFEHDLSEATTLRNTSRYGRYTLLREVTGVNGNTLGNLSTGTGPGLVVNDPEDWLVNRSRQRRDEANEVFTNQTNLTTAFGTGGVEHSVSTGAEIIHERHVVFPLGGINQLNANLYAPSTADSFTALARNGARMEGKTLTGALYLFDTLRFSEQWSLSTGLRWDRYVTEYTNIPATATPPAAASHMEGRDDLFTAKLGVVFKPLPNGSIYANYANSQQPPGGQPVVNGTAPNFQLGTGNATNNPNAEPQKAVNIEVGTKWDLLDNRLVVTAAAFDTRNKNDIVATDGITGEVVSRGERKVRGFELGASGMITPSWQISAGLASMKTKVTEGTINTTTPASSTEGAQLQFSPKLTFTSWTTYEFPFGLRVGGGARYVDSSFRNGSLGQAAQPTGLSETPSYWVVDAMAGYEVNEQVSLQLNVQNVTDEFYFASLNTGGSRYTLGTPRTILLTGRVKF